jgi:hypothetical protein
LTVEKKVARILKRIQTLDPVRYALYTGWWSTFFNETQWLKNANLVDIPDTAGGLIPKNCVLKQLAIQREPLPKQKRYVIDQSIWNVLDNDSRAGLILHELILRDAITHNDQTHSRFARYLHFNLADALFDKKNLQAYHQILQVAEFYETSFYEGIIASVEGLTHWSPMQVREAHDVQLPLSYAAFVYSTGFPMVSWAQSGDLAIIKSNGNPIRIQNTKVMVYGEIEFWSGNRVKSFNLIFPQTVVLQCVNGNLATFTAAHRLEQVQLNQAGLATNGDCN